MPEADTIDHPYDWDIPLPILEIHDPETDQWIVLELA
jgi:hypothetical protein